MEFVKKPLAQTELRLLRRYFFSCYQLSEFYAAFVVSLPCTSWNSTRQSSPFFPPYRRCRSASPTESDTRQSRQTRPASLRRDSHFRQRVSIMIFCSQVLVGFFIGEFIHRCIPINFLSHPECNISHVANRGDVSGQLNGTLEIVQLS